jgi:hypothetical protein
LGHGDEAGGDAEERQARMAQEAAASEPYLVEVPLVEA